MSRARRDTSTLSNIPSPNDAQVNASLSHVHQRSNGSTVCPRNRQTQMTQIRTWTLGSQTLEKQHLGTVLCARVYTNYSLNVKR